jgi:Gpi18-like mannosyltransferase
LALLGVFYQLARLDHDPATAWIALLLLTTFPVAFILFAPYTESLFLLWAAATFYSIRRERWGLAALFSFLAALTRQQGIFLALPIAWGIWETSKKSNHEIRRIWFAWLAPLAAPAGLGIWGIYRIGYLHEGSLDFSNIQRLIYSALLSPSADKVIAGQAFRWPWDAFIVAISNAIHAPELNVFINLGLGIGFLIAFIFAWRYLKIADRLYSLAIIVISFSVTTGQYTYVSLPRHLFLAFPVFIGLAEALQKSRQKQFLLACQTLGLIFLIYAYVLNGWIP